MSSVKVSEATNIQLDWLVAQSEGAISLRFDGEFWRVLISEPDYIDYEEYLGNLNYSTDWSKMGPIIERERIDLQAKIRAGSDIDEWRAVKGFGGFSRGRHGPTPLIAAARCYVATKLGEIVEVPEELV